MSDYNPSAKPACDEYQADGTRKGVCTCGSVQLAHSESIIDIAKRAIETATGEISTEPWLDGEIDIANTRAANAVRDMLAERIVAASESSAHDPNEPWWADEQCGYKLTDRYAVLKGVLANAVEHASEGKGSERHDPNGEFFEDQQIVQFGEWMGSTHGAIQQACKKSIESTGLPDDRARDELLGAINYLAAAVAIIDRRKAGK